MKIACMDAAQDVDVATVAKIICVARIYHMRFIILEQRRHDMRRRRGAPDGRVWRHLPEHARQGGTDGNDGHSAGIPSGGTCGGMVVVHALAPPAGTYMTCAVSS